MITTNFKISYFGFKFDRKSTYCYKILCKIIDCVRPAPRIYINEIVWNSFLKFYVMGSPEIDLFGIAHEKVVQFRFKKHILFNSRKICLKKANHSTKLHSIVYCQLIAIFLRNRYTIELFEAILGPSRTVTDRHGTSRTVTDHPRPSRIIIIYTKLHSIVYTAVMFKILRKN